jgi:hypothetical protein
MGPPTPTLASEVKTQAVRCETEELIRVRRRACPSGEELPSLTLSGFGCGFAALRQNFDRGAIREPNHVAVIGGGYVKWHQYELNFHDGARIQPFLDLGVAVRERESSGAVVVARRVIDDFRPGVTTSKQDPCLTIVAVGQEHLARLRVNSELLCARPAKSCLYCSQRPH